MKITKHPLTFRFDDVCGNADLKLIEDITVIIREKLQDVKIIYAVSPLYNTSNDQRIFPKIWNAYSDYRKYYNVDCGMVFSEASFTNITIASHGLCHVDHRLLTKEAQEMSILISCSLLKAKVFVPPFNKWNKDTAEICNEQGIELIRFEDGWKCCEYNEFSDNYSLWYLHAREFTMDSFTKWINQK